MLCSGVCTCPEVLLVPAVVFVLVVALRVSGEPHACCLPAWTRGHLDICLLQTQPQAVTICPHFVMVAAPACHLLSPAGSNLLKCSGSPYKHVIMADLARPTQTFNCSQPCQACNCTGALQSASSQRQADTGDAGSAQFRRATTRQSRQRQPVRVSAAVLQAAQRVCEARDGPADELHCLVDSLAKLLPAATPAGALDLEVCMSAIPCILDHMCRQDLADIASSLLAISN